MCLQIAPYLTVSGLGYMRAREEEEKEEEEEEEEEEKKEEKEEKEHGLKDKMT